MFIILWKWSKKQFSSDPLDVHNNLLTAVLVLSRHFVIAPTWVESPPAMSVSDWKAINWKSNGKGGNEYRCRTLPFIRLLSYLSKRRLINKLSRAYNCCTRWPTDNSHTQVPHKQQNHLVRLPFSSLMLITKQIYVHHFCRASNRSVHTPVAPIHTERALIPSNTISKTLPISSMYILSFHRPDAPFQSLLMRANSEVRIERMMVKCGNEVNCPFLFLPTRDSLGYTVANDIFEKLILE